MPTLSRYFIRSALICLGIGFTLGGFALSAKAGFVDVRAWLWLPTHIILLINGWLIQLSFGVAYWILPRIELHNRGRRAWAWSGFIAFQLGLMLTLVTILSLWEPEIQSLLPPAILAQAVGITLFAIHALPRIRPAFVRQTSSSQ